MSNDNINNITLKTFHLNKKCECYNNVFIEMYNSNLKKYKEFTSDINNQVIILFDDFYKIGIDHFFNNKALKISTIDILDVINLYYKVDFDSVIPLYMGDDTNDNIITDVVEFSNNHFIGYYITNHDKNTISDWFELLSHFIYSYRVSSKKLVFESGNFNTIYECLTFLCNDKNIPDNISVDMLIQQFTNIFNTH